VRFSFDDFSKHFITGVDLPSGEDLDRVVREILGVN
tara:strand:+ start:564 stop:671 length:108 start_codon:yes stop_codon:yes gene_type:complete